MPWCAGATAWCRWTSTSPAARRRRRRWSTASCSCKRRSAAPGRSSVAEPDAAPAAPPAPTLAEQVATLPGVHGVTVEKGEVVARAEAASLVALVTTLRDDPRFAFE